MNMIPVKSSAASAVGHEGETLTVQYSSGGVYKLEGVTVEQFNELLAAESFGRALNTLKASCAACVRVDDEDDNREPGDPDGEAFRGGEAAAAERESQAAIQRDLK